MHAFGANVLITRGISKGYGHFQTVLRGGSSLEEISKFAKSKKFNCKETPLFNFIPLDYVINDTLHLFLFVSDNLTELLIKEIRRKVVCENATCNNGFSWEKFKHDWLRNLSKISGHFFWMENPQRHQKNWTIEIKRVLKYLRWCKMFNYPHFCQETRSQKSFSCYGTGSRKSPEI